jgi:hypothetical protein
VVCERPAGAAGVPAGVGGGAVETAAVVSDAVTVDWVVVLVALLVLEVDVVVLDVAAVALVTLATGVEPDEDGDEDEDEPPQPASASAISSAGSHLMRAARTPAA